TSGTVAEQTGDESMTHSYSLFVHPNIWRKRQEAAQNAESDCSSFTSFLLRSLTFDGSRSDFPSQYAGNPRRSYFVNYSKHFPNKCTGSTLLTLTSGTAPERISDESEI